MYRNSEALYQLSYGGPYRKLTPNRPYGFRFRGFNTDMFSRLPW